ncbi:hypothetical protein KM043_012700 [Ampulex compressa]|nr:hypothetical protein KM043_012700 [Ampulex compressa]
MLLIYKIRNRQNLSNKDDPGWKGSAQPLKDPPKVSVPEFQFARGTGASLTMVSHKAMYPRFASPPLALLPPPSSRRSPDFVRSRHRQRHPLLVPGFALKRERRAFEGPPYAAWANTSRHPS